MRYANVRRVEGLLNLPTFVFGLVLTLAIMFIALGKASEKIPDNYAELQGEIIRVESENVWDAASNETITYLTVWAGYTCGEEEYTVELTSVSSSMKEGDPVTLYVNPNNPEEWLQPGGNLYVFAMAMGVAAVGFFVGIVISVKKIVNRKKGNEYA